MHPRAELDTDRDELGIDVIHTAWARNLLTLCLCRDEWILNVAPGGRPIQDVPDHFNCVQEQYQHWTGEVPEMHHRLKLDPESSLRTLQGEDVLLVIDRPRRWSAWRPACRRWFGIWVKSTPVLDPSSRPWKLLIRIAGSLGRRGPVAPRILI